MADPGSRLALAVLRWVVRRGRDGMGKPMRHVTTLTAISRLQSASDLVRNNIAAFSDAQLENLADEGLVLARAVSAEFARRRALEDEA